MLYINFPKKGVVETFLRGHSNAGFAGVWAGRELTFGRHLFSENWKVKIKREKGWTKECENAFCKMPCGKKRIRNWECKMPRENWKGKKRIRNVMEEKISGSKGTNKKIFSRGIKYCFQTKNMGHHGWDIPLRFARFARFVSLKSLSLFLYARSL